MQSNPYSPLSVVQCLTSAFDVVAGRVKPDAVFDYSAYGFWQAVFGNWFLGLILAAFPLFALGMKFVEICLLYVSLYHKTFTRFYFNNQKKLQSTPANPDTEGTG